MNQPLLVVDGDSFAHRSYHALPKSIRRSGNKGGGAIVGFANFLLRLYTQERPRAVLVGWDTLDAPTYRHRALPGYQGGRSFDPELLDQLEVLLLMRALSLNYRDLLVAEGVGHSERDPLVVDERPVRAIQILETPPVAYPHEERVLAGHAGCAQPDVVALLTADRDRGRQVAENAALIYAFQNLKGYQRHRQSPEGRPRSRAPGSDRRAMAAFTRRVAWSKVSTNGTVWAEPAGALMTPTAVAITAAARDRRAWLLFSMR